jgi:hypothetical protein
MEDLINLSPLGLYLNFLLIILISFISYNNKIISKTVLLLIILSCTGPILLSYLTNIYFIFPDQGGYYDNIILFRNYYDFDNLRHKDLNQNFTLLSSLIYIPSISDFYNASYLNKYILVIFLIYLIKSNYLSNNQALIILLYPSLFIYSSLLLKEMIIIAFLVLAYIYLTEKRYSISLSLILATSLIKPYLPIMFFIIYVIYFCFFIQRYKSDFYLSFFMLIALIFFINLDNINDNINFLIDRLNLLIYNFYLEDNNYSAEARSFSTSLIGFNLDSLIYIIQSIIAYFFKPMIFNASNIFQIAQSIENIIIFVLLVHFLKELYLKDIKKTYFFIFSIIFTSIPYAIIVSNIGTLSRYRFTILIIFILIIFFELNTNKKINEK